MTINIQDLVDSTLAKVAETEKTANLVENKVKTNFSKQLCKLANEIRTLDTRTSYNDLATYIRERYRNG